MKKAMIIGITGQDGSYLAELLLKKGYEVHGVKRRSSSFNTELVDHIYQDPHTYHQNFRLHYGDLTDTSNLVRLLSDIRPDEVYNLGAQTSFGLTSVRLEMLSLMQRVWQSTRIVFPVFL